MYKIKINREKCKSGPCGRLCVKLCPENWRVLDDKKAHPIKLKIQTLGNNKLAMDNCPFQAITIVKMD